MLHRLDAHAMPRLLVPLKHNAPNVMQMLFLLDPASLLPLHLEPVCATPIMLEVALRVLLVLLVAAVLEDKLLVHARRLMAIGRVALAPIRWSVYQSTTALLTIRVMTALARTVLLVLVWALVKTVAQHLPEQVLALPMVWVPVFAKPISSVKLPLVLVLLAPRTPLVLPVSPIKVDAPVPLKIKAGMLPVSLVNVSILI